MRANSKGTFYYYIQYTGSILIVYCVLFQSHDERDNGRVDKKKIIHNKCVNVAFLNIKPLLKKIKIKFKPG